MIFFVNFNFFVFFTSLYRRASVLVVKYLENIVTGSISSKSYLFSHSCTFETETRTYYCTIRIHDLKPKVFHQNCYKLPSSVSGSNRFTLFASNHHGTFVLTKSLLSCDLGFNQLHCVNDRREQPLGLIQVPLLLELVS